MYRRFRKTCFLYPKHEDVGKPSSKKKVYIYIFFLGRLFYIFVFQIEEAGFSETSVHRSIYQTKGLHIPEDCNIKDKVINKVID
jgi:hypothetical protein